MVYCSPPVSPLHVCAQHPPSSFTSTVFQPCNATDISQTSVLPWRRSTSRDLEPWTNSGKAIKVLLPRGSYGHASFPKVLHLKCLEEFLPRTNFFWARGSICQMSIGVFSNKINTVTFHIRWQRRDWRKERLLAHTPLFK